MPLSDWMIVKQTFTLALQFLFRFNQLGEVVLRVEKIPFPLPLTVLTLFVELHVFVLKGVYEVKFLPSLAASAKASSIIHP